METAGNEILELRLFGDNISPKVFKSKEVGELLISLEGALTSYIFQNHSDVDISELLLSPVAIEDSSLGLKFSPNLKAYFIAAYTAISGAIASNNLENIPNRTVESLREIQRIIRIKNCAAEFKLDGRTLASIDSNTNLTLQKNVISVDTIIYGEIQRVGGLKPTAWVVLNNEKRIIVQLDKAQAKQLSNRLYEEVGFRGTATWSRETNSILDFKVGSLIVQYEPKSIKESFNEIKSIIGKYWDNIGDVDDALLKS